MRLKVTHPDYPALGFYVPAFTADVEDQVNRLGPIDRVAASYDWPPDTRPGHGWADTVNSLWWPRGADQFATLFLLIDDARATLVKYLVAAQIFETAGDITTLGTLSDDLGASLSILQSATDESTTSTLRSQASGDLQEALVAASAGAVEFAAGGFLSSYQSTLTADWTATQDLVDTQVSGGASGGVAPRPYLVLQAVLAPKEGASAGEGYDACGHTAVSSASRAAATAEVVFHEWKLYPLAPVRLTEPDATDALSGLWVLPLVDLRFFWRQGPVESDRDGSGSGSGASGSGSGWPVSDVLATEDSDEWMPPLLAYPQDLTAPADYDPILNIGTHPGVSAVGRRGPAADLQSSMEGWRVVCRDVRSDYNCASAGTAHDEFTGIVADYPDAQAATTSYHLDAVRLAAVTGNLISGGLTDAAVARALRAHKLRVRFPVTSLDSAYEVDVYPTANDPATTADLADDTDGPTDAERLHLPFLFVGVPSPSEDPTTGERDDLVVAAKQRGLLYYRWRQKQAYFVFPGVAPLIPNGYASLIRWDFQATLFRTTYVAAEGLGEPGDDGSCCGAGGGGDRVEVVELYDSGVTPPDGYLDARIRYWRVSENILEVGPVIWLKDLTTGEG